MASKAKPHILRMGVDTPSGSPEQMADRISRMKATVEKYLPDFVAELEVDDLDVITLHQDAFASGFHYDEFTILGMAIKYAGFKGVKVWVIGKNHETF